MIPEELDQFYRPNYYYDENYHRHSYSDDGHYSTYPGNLHRGYYDSRRDR